MSAMGAEPPKAVRALCAQCRSLKPSEPFPASGRCERQHKGPGRGCLYLHNHGDDLRYRDELSKPGVFGSPSDSMASARTPQVSEALSRLAAEDALEGDRAIDVLPASTSVRST